MKRSIVPCHVMSCQVRSGHVFKIRYKYNIYMYQQFQSICEKYLTNNKHGRPAPEVAPYEAQRTLGQSAKILPIVQQIRVGVGC